MGRETSSVHEGVIRLGPESGRVASAAALGLAALGAVLFLDADEAQATTMLTDHTGTLDGLREALEQLVEALGVTHLNTHTRLSPFLRGSVADPVLFDTEAATATIHGGRTDKV